MRPFPTRPPALPGGSNFPVELVLASTGNTRELLDAANIVQGEAFKTGKFPFMQLDLKYDLTRDDSWFVNVSYAVARLTAPHGDIGEFYRYGLANASITNVRQLGGSPVYFAGSFGSQFRHGDPSAFDRVTAYANAAFFYSPIEHLQLTAFVRPEGQFYTNDPIDSSRTDLNFSVGASAVLTPVEYVSLGVTASFVGNYSSSSRADYEVVSPSLFIGGRISF